MNDTRLDGLTARLQQVERRLRVAILGWVLSLVAMTVLWVGAREVASQSSDLRARAFHVVDQAGRERIALAMDTSGRPAVWLLDEGGKARVFMGFGQRAGRPQISLNDETERQRVYLGFGIDNGTPLLKFNDEAGVGRLSLGFGSLGQTALWFYDRAGKERVLLGFATGDPGLRVYDATGDTVLWSAP